MQIYQYRKTKSSIRLFTCQHAGAKLYKLLIGRLELRAVSRNRPANDKRNAKRQMQRKMLARSSLWVKFNPPTSARNLRKCRHNNAAHPIAIPLDDRARNNAACVKRSSARARSPWPYMLSGAAARATDIYHKNAKYCARVHAQPTDGGGAAVRHIVCNIFPCIMFVISRALYSAAGRLAAPKRVLYPGHLCALVHACMHVCVCARVCNSVRRRGLLSPIL